MIGFSGRRISGTLIGLLLLTGLQSTAVSAGTPDDIIDCYKAFSATYFCDIAGNCSMKHKFVPLKYRFTQRCIQVALTCPLKDEAQGIDPGKCLDKAQVKCDKSTRRFSIASCPRSVYSVKRCSTAATLSPFPMTFWRSWVGSALAIMPNSAAPSSGIPSDRYRTSSTARTRGYSARWKACSHPSLRDHRTHWRAFSRIHLPLPACYP